MVVRIDDVETGDTITYFNADNDEGAFTKADCIVAESGRDREFGYDGYILHEVYQHGEVGDTLKREIE
jgi:hypothetical protein